MNKLGLLSTDFDGTLLPKPWEEAGEISKEFFERLAAKRRQEPIYWVVNTGRTWPFLKQELEALEAPIWPDWVVTVEREIWQIQGREAVALGNWNQECDLKHASLFATAGALWPQVEAFLRSETRAVLLPDVRSPLVIRGEDEKEIERVARFVEPLLASWANLAMVRNSIYLNFSHAAYNKGTCLGALAAHLKVPASEIFAIGDHFNDLPMLHRDCAAHVGCPGNSVEEVKAHVRAQEGYVAKAHATEGVLEAWDYFFGN